MTFTECPVRYFDGSAGISVTDISSPRGDGFGHTRRYENRMVTMDFDGPNGWNWLVDQLPFVSANTPIGWSEVEVVIDPKNPYWFDYNSTTNTFTPRHGTARATLTMDGGYFFFKQVTGAGVRMYTFYDFSAVNLSGRLKSLDDESGVSTVLNYYNIPGTPVIEHYRVLPGGVQEALDYTYTSSNKIASITLKRGVGTGPTTWTNLRRVVYTYHDGSDSGGDYNDLKSVKQQIPNGTGWDMTAVTLYRYYGSWDNPDGTFSHALKYVLNPEGYRRMVNASLDPEDASVDISAYAEHYFKYDNQRRVTYEVATAGCATCSGGAAGTTGDTFEYDWNHIGGTGNPYNIWINKTTVTQPDENETIVYTNQFGQVILKVFHEHDTTNNWYQFNKYDDHGRLLFTTDSKAVTAVDDTSTTSLVTLGDGAYSINEYYDETNATTGAVKGYIKAKKIATSESATPITMEEYQYFVSDDQQVHPLKKHTVYPTEGGSGIESSYAYEWFDSVGKPDVMKKVTTTLPAVPTDQNGSGVSATTIDECDESGLLVKHTDERGYVIRYAYDDVNRKRTQTKYEMESGTTDDLITDYEYDEEGRLVQTLGPVHKAVLSSGSAVDVRTASWFVYTESAQPTSGTWEEDQTWSGQGYASGSGFTTFTLIDPVSIHKQDKAGRTTDSIVSKRTSGSGKLATGNTFSQSDWKRWSSSQYNNQGQLVSSRRYHTIPSSGDGSSGTNYDQSEFGYEVMGHLNRMRSPGGTIARTIFNARGLVTSTWVGTDDTPATGAWSPSNTTDADLVMISENVYDGGSAGLDGNVTQATQYATGDDTHVTTFTHDWRNRLETVDGEIDTFAKIYYDNLNRVIKAEQYDSLEAGNLVDRSEAKFDDRGLVYRTLSYAVNPSTGSVGNSLVGDHWYDASGRPIKASMPGSHKTFNKMRYDGLGRMSNSYVGYDTDSSEGGYSAASTVSGDTIFSQSEFTFDAASNVIAVSSRERLNDATGTGALTTIGGSQPKARVSYSATWYDSIGRSIASADYGTNGDSDFTRPDTVPTRSDDVLLSSTEYNDASEGFKSIDPKGIENRSFFDQAGRIKYAVENHASFDPSNESGTGDSSDKSKDRATKYIYTADGQVKQLIAMDQNGDGNLADNQVTTYVYGTTITESGVARADLLRATIYPDSDDTDTLGNGTDSTYDRVELKYNRLGQAIERKDQNQTVHEYNYDKLGRLIHDRINHSNFGDGVDQTVKRISREYDVRGMLSSIYSHTAYIPEDDGYELDRVTFVYDSFGQLTSEQQNRYDVTEEVSASGTVSYGYTDGTDNVLRPTTLTYPNGRVITYGYGSTGSTNDLVNRVESLIDSDTGSTHLADYTYMGAGTVLRVDYTQPQVRLDLWGGTSGSFSGIDRFGRVIQQLWRYYGSSAADRDKLEYGYDRDSNRTFKDNLVATSGMDEFYSYDNLNRLTVMQRGDLNTGRTAISGTAAKEEDCTLDALGNWSSYLTKTAGTTDLDHSRAHNKSNETGTITTTTGTAWATPAHDAVGNMTTMPKPNDSANAFTAVYDAWNRLVELKSGSNTVARYQYDGRGRRITKRTYTGGTLAEMRQFFHTAADQVIEERISDSTDAQRQYVWGLRYIDELVLRDRDADADTGHTLEERLYALQDANFNVTSLVNISGAVTERYAYSPFGMRSVFDASFAGLTSSANDWTVGHQGLGHDGESGLVYNRSRYLHTSLGRFTGRDVLGYSDGANLYLYVRSNPIVNLDPLGQKTWMGRFLDCMEDCLENNDPITGLIGAILAGASAERAAELLYNILPREWIAMNKNAMADIAEKLGETRVAEAVRKNAAAPGANQKGALKTFIEMLKRRGETATKIFQRDLKKVSKGAGALAAVMAVIELGRYTHCSAMCGSLATSKCEYNPEDDKFIEDYLREYDIID